MLKLKPIPAVQIKKLKGRMELISGYVRKCPPKSKAQAIAMLKIIGQIAENAVEEATL